VLVVVLKVELGGEPRELSKEGNCGCKFARSYWLLCCHVILAFEFYQATDEPDQQNYTDHFNESRFKIYNSRMLCDIEEKRLI
jgi:hypothetical protein